MKKTLYINLNGFAFHIDEDAYDALHQYLDKIERSFTDKEEAKEIVSDIEARIAELFHGKKKSSEEVITLTEVEEVISTIGQPQDIADEQQPEENESESNTSAQGSPSYRKRLYRDPDNRKLGGVCGGLGAYFDIDPLVFRIIFLLTFFLYGSSLLVYIILWIVMPKALTITQKLEMKGPAGYENWEKNIRKEYQEVSEKFKQSKAYHDISGSFAKGTDVMGNALRGTVRALVSMIGIVLMTITLTVLVSLVLTFTFGFTLIDFSGAGNYITSLPSLFMTGNDMIFGSIGLVLITCIPLLMLFYLGFKLVFNFKSKSKAIGLSALALWVVGLILVFYASARVAREYTVGEEASTKIQLELPLDSTIYLQSNPSTLTPDHKEHLFDLNQLNVYMSNEKIYVQGNTRVELIRGEKYAIEINKSAKGRSSTQATKNCNDVEFFWLQKDSVLYLDPFFTLQQESKVRNQELKVIITVPQGVQITVDDKLEWIVNNRLNQ